MKTFDVYRPSEEEKRRKRVEMQQIISLQIAEARERRSTSPARKATLTDRSNLDLEFDGEDIIEGIRVKSKMSIRAKR